MYATAECHSQVVVVNPPSFSQQSLAHASYTLSGCPCKDSTPRRLLGSRYSGHLADYGLVSILSCLITWDGIPLDTGKHGGNIVCRTPPVLKDIKAQLSRRIYVWMEHLADELHNRRLVRILLLELHDEPEGAILKRRVGGTDYNSVPISASVPPLLSTFHQFL